MFILQKTKETTGFKSLQTISNCLIEMSLNSTSSFDSIYFSLHDYSYLMKQDK